MTAQTISIPNVQLTLDQLINVVKQLEPAARSKIAEALLSDEMDSRFASLIQRLSEKSDPQDISFEDINAELNSVRNRTS